MESSREGKMLQRSGRMSGGDRGSGRRAQLMFEDSPPHYEQDPGHAAATAATPLMHADLPRHYEQDPGHVAAAAISYVPHAQGDKQEPHAMPSAESDAGGKVTFPGTAASTMAAFTATTKKSVRSTRVFYKTVSDRMNETIKEASSMIKNKLTSPDQPPASVCPHLTTCPHYASSDTGQARGHSAGNDAGQARGHSGSSNKVRAGIMPVASWHPDTPTGFLSEVGVAGWQPKTCDGPQLALEQCGLRQPPELLSQMAIAEQLPSVPTEDDTQIEPHDSGSSDGLADAIKASMISALLDEPCNWCHAITCVLQELKETFDLLIQQLTEIDEIDKKLEYLEYMKMTRSQMKVAQDCVDRLTGLREFAKCPDTTYDTAMEEKDKVMREVDGELEKFGLMGQVLSKQNALYYKEEAQADELTAALQDVSSIMCHIQREMASLQESDKEMHQSFSAAALAFSSQQTEADLERLQHLAARMKQVKGELRVMGDAAGWLAECEMEMKEMDRRSESGSTAGISKLEAVMREIEQSFHSIGLQHHLQAITLRSNLQWQCVQDNVQPISNAAADYPPPPALKLGDDATAAPPVHNKFTSIPGHATRPASLSSRVIHSHDGEYPLEKFECKT